MNQGKGVDGRRGLKQEKKKLLSVLFEGAAVPLVVQLLSRGI